MTEQEERLRTEVSLLESMYPDQIQYNGKSREVLYHADNASFILRLPAEYLDSSLPDVLSASQGRLDLRESLRDYIKQCETGEEVLDSIILAFNEMAESHARETETAAESMADRQKAAMHSDTEHKATIIVWLHHLLNTNKRKQALSPPSPDVSGITKPGYPGVLIYSGPASAVHEQVNELKQLNWAAFQVRLESEDEWSFTHGAGVKEVEAMKDVVAEVGEARKEVFLEAMRMK